MPGTRKVPGAFRRCWVAVGSLLGYTQQGSFTDWFRSRFGMTPRSWRNSRLK
ncbi:hypothetical protein WJ542_23385 [Paraburkholderia sp. B3]